jgi:hypothetical protein
MSNGDGSEVDYKVSLRNSEEIFALPQSKKMKMPIKREMGSERRKNVIQFSSLLIKKGFSVVVK